MNGHDSHEDDKTVLYYWSANRDESVFDGPKVFASTRSPNPHVGFGGRDRISARGANLARREISVMLRELHTLCPASGRPARLRLRSSFINGIKHLPCDFG